MEATLKMNRLNRLNRLKKAAKKINPIPQQMVSTGQSIQPLNFQIQKKPPLFQTGFLISANPYGFLRRPDQLLASEIL